MRLVLNVCSLIPCCGKSKEDIEGIRSFGNCLAEFVEHGRERIIICVSKKLMKTYFSKLREIERCGCHPLPKFHASFYRNISRIARITRHKKCTSKKLKTLGVCIHVIGSNIVNKYVIDDICSLPEDDKEVVKIALAIAKKDTVYIVTVDEHFIKCLDLRKLERKYSHANRIKVVKPQDLLVKIEN